LAAPVRLASTQNVRAVVSLICAAALTLVPEIENAVLSVLVHPACVASWNVAGAHDPTEHVADRVASGFADVGIEKVGLDKLIAEITIDGGGGFDASIMLCPAHIAYAELAPSASKPAKRKLVRLMDVSTPQAPFPTG
jgi:hypothetical protein